MWRPEKAIETPQQTKPASKSSAVIKDSWEDEDEEDDQAEVHVEDQVPIRGWENTEFTASMPNVILQPTSVTAPPLAALHTPMRILKRPDPKPTTAADQISSGDVKSFTEREAEYQAARDRIFNEQKPSPRSIPRSTPSTTCATPIRNPIGPTDGPGGFLRRNRLDNTAADARKSSDAAGEL